MTQEKLKLELPTLERKKEALDYLHEFETEGVHPYGSNKLYTLTQPRGPFESYENWVEYCKFSRNATITTNGLPKETYFVTRTNDNRIVGMISIRMSLDDENWNNGGNIGYSIRKSERRKGYAKTALYLALLRCQAKRLEAVLLDCERSNIPSMRTMFAMGAKLIRTHWSSKYKAWNNVYVIDVDRAIGQNYGYYKNKINK